MGPALPLRRVTPRPGQPLPASLLRHDKQGTIQKLLWGRGGGLGRWLRGGVPGTLGEPACRTPLAEDGPLHLPRDVPALWPKEGPVILSSSTRGGPAHAGLSPGLSGCTVSQPGRSPGAAAQGPGRADKTKEPEVARTGP